MAVFRGDSAGSTTVLDVSIAAPESILLTLAIHDIFEAFVDEHDATALGFCELQTSRDVNC